MNGLADLLQIVHLGLVLHVDIIGTVVLLHLLQALQAVQVEVHLQAAHHQVLLVLPEVHLQVHPLAALFLLLPFIVVFLLMGVFT